MSVNRFFSFGMVSGSTQSNPVNEMWYKMGQSNGLGYPGTSLNDLPVAYQGTFPLVKTWNELTPGFESVNTTGNNLNQYPVTSRNNGFSYSLVAAIDYTNTTGNTVYLCEYTVGGTPMYQSASVDWNVNSTGDLWDSFQSHITACKNWMTTNSISFIEKYSDFQGESDALGTELQANQFGANRMDFYEAFDTFLGYSINKNVIRPHSGLSATYKTAIFDAINNITSGNQVDGRSIDNATLVTCDEFAIAADNIHLTSASQVSLGQKYALVV